MNKKLSFSELKKNYKEINDIPYTELINTSEWFKKREIILIRDNYCCTNCLKEETMNHYDEFSKKNTFFWFKEVADNKNIDNDKIVEINSDISVFKSPNNYDVVFSLKPYSLHVHHKFYVLDNLPWEYLDEDLVTLCNWCHLKFHEENIVPVYKTINNKIEQLNYTPCYRCHGAGYLPEYNYHHSGVCFKCNGKRFLELIDS